ncbi:MAG TPA: hypothetical protein VN515_10365 [Terriglobales bacterium]|nr:hypothetical protein [Terriglobales bacterium]
MRYPAKLAPALRLSALSVLLAGSGCLLPPHSLPLPATGQPAPAATADELIAGYNANAARIQTILLTADVGTASLRRVGVFGRLLSGLAWLGGRVRHARGRSYVTLSGYLILQKPASLRIFASLPVVGGRAFDMASNGDNFELSLPTLGEFIEGRNDCVPTGEHGRLQRLRPAEILEALPVFPVESAVPFRLTNAPNGDYRLLLPARSTAQRAVAMRQMEFDPGDKRLRRQSFYDADGATTLIVDYDDYVMASGIAFPQTIAVTHPGVYALLLQLTKAPTVNGSAPAWTSPSAFVLTPPRGAKIVNQSECGAASVPAIP